MKEVLSYDKGTGKFTWVAKTSLNGVNRIGQIAGCITTQGYVHIKIDGYVYKAHRLVWLYIHGCFPTEDGKCFIDHIDQNCSNNKLDNLRVVSNAENGRNRRRAINNKSGTNGVFRAGFPNNSKKTPTINYYWVARWYNGEGQQLITYFSIKKHGEDGAKQMAILHRQEQLRLLKLNHNIVYSDIHGI